MLGQGSRLKPAYCCVSLEEGKLSEEQLCSPSDIINRQGRGATGLTTLPASFMVHGHVFLSLLIYSNL